MVSRSFKLFSTYILLLILSSHITKQDNGLSIRCFWIEEDKYTVYDLKNLQLPNDVATDREIPKPVTELDNSVYFNFCQVLKEETHKCNDKTGQIVSVNSKDKKCTIYSGSNLNESEFSLLNKDDPNAGLIVKLNNGDICKDDIRYTVTWELTCSEDEKIVITSSTFYGNETCNHVVKAKTKDSCPKVNFYVVWSFLNNNSSFIGAIIILIGFFLLFLGLKLLKVTMFITSLLVVLFLCFILFFQLILPTGTKQWVVWTILGCSVLLGIILGFVTVYYRKIFFGLLGGLLGYVVGNIVYTIVLKYINSNPTVVYWVTVVVCIAIFASLAFFLVKLIVILATSVIGAYGMIRGISLYAGDFPSESMIIDLINKQEYEELKKFMTYQVYLYFAGMVILIIAGMIVQFKINKDVNLDSKEEDKSDDEEMEGKEYEIKRRLV